MINHTAATSHRCADSEPAAGAPRLGSPPLRGIAYLADPTALHGAGVLFAQKRAIDGYASNRKFEIRRYVIDSGRPDDNEVVGHRLRHLLPILRSKSDAVLVEHVSRFAPDYAVALRIAAALSSWGVAVHEARGGLALVEQDLAIRLAANAFDGIDSLRRTAQRPSMFCATGARRSDMEGGR